MLPGEPGWEVREKRIDDMLAQRLAAATERSQRKKAAYGALEAVFHENAVPMSDRNGQLYDTIEDGIDA